MNMPLSISKIIESILCSARGGDPILYHKDWASLSIDNQASYGNGFQDASTGSYVASNNSSFYYSHLTNSPSIANFRAIVKIKSFSGQISFIFRTSPEAFASGMNDTYAYIVVLESGYLSICRGSNSQFYKNFLFLAGVATSGAPVEDIDIEIIANGSSLSASVSGNTVIVDDAIHSNAGQFGLRLWNSSNMILTSVDIFEM